MEYKRKRLAFFTCSNGYGHFKRILEVSKYLQKDYIIDIFCEKFQYDKFKPEIWANFIFYKMPNIRWDKAVKKDNVDFESYKEWVDYYGKQSDKYDYVISDNIAGILEYRKDAILMGSFLWKDIYLDKFSSNRLTSYDERLIDKYNPTIITNRFTETHSIQGYNNKVQFGFGCEPLSKFEYWDYFDTVVTVPPSLNYLDSYKESFKLIEQSCKNSWTISSDLSITERCIYVIRPGVGMITHCVEHNIPIIALYDPNDSTEILALAEMVERLGIGISHNTDNITELMDGYFQAYKLKKFFSNRIYNKANLEKSGYRHTANYLKQIML